MLTEPASNVSVPLAVVRRMRSKVPPNAILPAAGKTAGGDPALFMLLMDTQVFPVIFVRINIQKKDQQQLYC